MHSSLSALSGFSGREECTRNTVMQIGSIAEVKLCREMSKDFRREGGIRTNVTVMCIIGPYSGNVTCMYRDDQIDASPRQSSSEYSERPSADRPQQILTSCAIWVAARPALAHIRMHCPYLRAAFLALCFSPVPGESSRSPHSIQHHNLNLDHHHSQGLPYIIH